MPKLPKLKKTVLATLLTTPLIAGMAHAQQPAPQPADEHHSADTLDKVVVTARKRNETILEVPMNITAISASELKERNLSSVQDIYRTIAGGASPTGQLILRGLSGGNTASPGTTSQFVDGIPLGLANIFDVERVEVLRGPQGTLWGSNAIGGTVQIVTVKPQMNEWEVFGTYRLGSEKDVAGINRRIEAGLNIPLVNDRLAARIVASTAESPGKIVNAATGVQANGKADFLRAQLQWEPTEEMFFNFGYITSKSKNVGTRLADRSKPGFYRVARFSENPGSPWGFDVNYDQVTCDPNWERPACLSGANTRVKAPSRYTVHELMDNWSKGRTNLASISAGHENLFGFASLNYVGSYREYTGSSLDNWSRLDMDDMMKTWIVTQERSKRITHEIRLQ
ncbi:TonB-dependent receptor plug domain-containing protein [Solilutibacter pythonis]|uniref:TonB-dependent receptor plug domain-containing protein n=1 Tax=Solilutibacter pythonis TaxID=2483112 RepID=UPI001B866460|nr:TonB-dependent receptor plug domain-containing protein [Lysobacter pythonis]